ncbi:Fc.00g022260.m01.CDS01 [Cosmosporella sp. VM-42]
MCISSLVTCSRSGCNRIAVVRIDQHCEGALDHVDPELFADAEVWARETQIRMDNDFKFSEPPGCTGLHIRNTLEPNNTLCTVHSNSSSAPVPTENPVGRRAGDDDLGHNSPSQDEANLTRGVAALNLNVDDETVSGHARRKQRILNVNWSGNAAPQQGDGQAGGA